MASQVSTGSPKLNRRQTPSMKLVASTQDNDRTPRNIGKSASSKSATPVATLRRDVHPPQVDELGHANAGTVHDVSSILTQLRVNDARHPTPVQTKQQDHFDKVLANLKDQHKMLKKQQMDLKDDSDTASYRDHDRSSGSDLFTPATETFETDVHDAEEKQDQQNPTEMARIKQELEAAKSVINRQELELAESRTLRHTMEQAMGPASEADFPLRAEPTAVPSMQVPGGFNVSARPFTSRVEPSWHMIDDGKADLAATLVGHTSDRGRNWNHAQAAWMRGVTDNYQPVSANREPRANSYGYGTNYTAHTSPIELNFPRNRAFSSGSSNVSYGIEERLVNGGLQGPSHARHRYPGNPRTNSTLTDPLSPVTSVGSFGHTLVDANPLSSVAVGGQFGYHDPNFGSQAPSLACQFPAGGSQVFPSDLPLVTNTGLNTSNYVMAAEPMNYRRLLDKSVSCDWKYIVDKIVCNNDQQASIFLQQKLKVGTAEQKYEIVESIVNQAYPLMINRFGNFLVQRCFEHGTPDQVIAIADAIHGNVISLSMDPFGCHVIQKAFDSVPEDHKADMVRELLRRIPDTVIHRYACHVWQKLFELRWSGEPPQIMVKVNEALRGMWHEVALGETGSLVVQNIFENCVEEEKRPAIEEVISNIDLIAHGQFGNWCIQHLCEHGSPPDKRRVVDHILKNSYNYSIDQFASKVVEKCLKIGGPEFLDRYLGVITTARPDRPRIPLIDIAGDQYGNYLIQWILMNTHQHQREQVAIHIRKHMVSLRGSKFGSRVAMLCSNPASITRPGTASAIVNAYGAPPQQRIGGRYR